MLMLNSALIAIFSFSSFTACTQGSTSETKIIGQNSRDYSNHRIRALTILTTGETCSVSFVRRNSAITAGHCIPDEAARNFECPLSIDGERPTACGKVTLDPSLTYGLETVSRDIGFMIFSEASARRLHGDKEFGLNQSDFYTTKNPTTVDMAGFGENFVRTSLINGKYVPIKGGGDLTGIGRPGRAGVRQLRACRTVITDPSRSFFSNHEMIEVKPEHQQGSVCMPTAGDSGGALLDAQGNLIGIAIAVEYGPNRVERAVYLSLVSKAIPQAIQEFFKRLKNELGL